MSRTEELAKRGLISPPRFLPGNVHYETIMGSVAYGVSSDTSDMDVYGFCIPEKEMIWPHLRGEIPGFGEQIQRFEQWQEHHIDDNDAHSGHGRVYDMTIYSIVRYFQLCMENNPNMIDSLFTSQSCVLHCTAIGQHVRDNRHVFLHRGAWHKFKGYAYAQVHKMSAPKEARIGKRLQLFEQFGYDVKFAYHVVRLIDEIEQILTLGDLDLQRDRERLKAIRRGEWKQEEIVEFFNRREKELETAYQNSPLPVKPDEGRIKRILLECLEMHYGSLDKCVVTVDAATHAIDDIQAVIDRYRSR